jgi:hypothetical protein
MEPHKLVCAHDKGERSDGGSQGPGADPNLTDCLVLSRACLGLRGGLFCHVFCHGSSHCRGRGSSTIAVRPRDDRPASGGVAALRHADDDLAEMRARSHVLISRMNLVEAEHLVDHRLDSVGRNGTVHRLEHLRRADRNTLHVGAAGQDQPRIKFGCSPAQATDQANLAADPDGAELRRLVRSFFRPTDLP